MKNKFNIDEERQRLQNMLQYEKQYEGQIVAGIDEAGRGPLCGEVYVACVVLDLTKEILFLNDSKKLTEKKREELFVEIKNKSLSYGIGVASVEEIDKYNILQATYIAAKRSYDECSKKIKIDTLLTDALKITQLENVPQIPIIKGDTLSLSIAAASVLAKVSRDKKMLEYAKMYPGYFFEKNKGYGTKLHIEKLKEMGPCPIHRKTFIKNFV